MSVEVGRELGVCGYNLARPGAGVPRAQAPGQGGMCVCVCVSQVGGAVTQHCLSCIVMVC